MRVSRTRFSKRRAKRKTEFPIVAVLQKKRKNPSSRSKSFSTLRQLQTPSLTRLETEKANKTSWTGEESALAQNTKKKVDSARPQKKSRATIDYKNVILLRNLITAEGKILPRRINKLTAKQQRYVQKSIKSARIMGLIPFINKSRPV